MKSEAHIQDCPDLFAFDALIDFVLERGVDGVVIGGGTAEYPRFDGCSQRGVNAGQGRKYTPSNLGRHGSGWRGLALWFGGNKGFN